MTPATAVAGQIGGEVVGAQQIFTQETVNQAWRRFQEVLAGLGFKRLSNEAILAGFTPVGTTDPGVMAYVNWSNYFDGVTLQTGPVLPQDFIAPERLWERVSGSGAAFTPMDYTLNGITDQPKMARSYQWEWRGDAIYFPGSTSSMDMRVRYYAYLGDFLTVGGIQWYNQPVPISRCLSAYAWYICSEFANARGDTDGKDFDAKGEAEATKLVQREIDLATKRSEWTIPDIPPQTGATPFDTVSTIWNTARVRMNKVNKLGGDVMVINQPFSQQLFNTAYRRFQEYLGNLGYTVLKDEFLAIALGPSVATDPAIQVSISWTGYFNGATTSLTPALPQNLMFPLKLQERQSGQDALFFPMQCMLDGIPTMAPQTYNRVWEWRANTIFMPGATFTTDLRILFAKYLPDIIPANSLPWYLQPVPIARCQDPLSLFICAEVANSRPDLEMNPFEFQQQAENAADLIFNRDVRMKQRVNARRRSRSGRLEGNQGWTPGLVYG